MGLLKVRLVVQAGSSELFSRAGSKSQDTASICVDVSPHPRTCCFVLRAWFPSRPVSAGWSVQARVQDVASSTRSEAQADRLRLQGDAEVSKRATSNNTSSLSRPAWMT